MKEKQLRSSYSASNSSQEELDGKSVEELYREEECTDGSTRRDRQNLLDENADYQDQSIERVRHNLLQHLLKLFSSEGPLEPPSPVAAAAMAASKMDLNVRDKRSSGVGPNLGHGFSSMLESLKGGKGKRRNYEGYTRLNPEPMPSRGQKIILDPHTPITWSSKSHFVQRPSTYDALDGLLASEEGIVERRIVCKGPPNPPNSNDHNKEENTLAKDDDDEKKKNVNCNNNMKFVGIFLAAVSGLFFTLCSVTVKLLHRIDPSEVLLFRAIVQLVLTIPMLIFMKANPLGPKGVRLIVYLQGVIGCLTVSCIFIGFARLPVGDAATIIFCSPIFVMVFSYVLLNEHCGIFRVFVIGLLLFGVILIAKPPFLIHALMPHDNTLVNSQQQNDYDILGYGAALCGTLLTASNFVCMRKLREVHFSVLIFAFSVMSALMSAAVVGCVAEFKLPRDTEEWVYAVMVGVFGLFGQSLLAVALRYETAGVVSVTRSMDIAVAYVIQITWFGDIPMWTSILGAFVVILAVFAMAMEEAFLTLLNHTCGSAGWC